MESFSEGNSAVSAAPGTPGLKEAPDKQQTRDKGHIKPQMLALTPGLFLYTWYQLKHSHTSPCDDSRGQKSPRSCHPARTDHCHAASSASAHIFAGSYYTKTEFIKHATRPLLKRSHMGFCLFSTWHFMGLCSVPGKGGKETSSLGHPWGTESRRREVAELLESSTVFCGAMGQIGMCCTYPAVRRSHRSTLKKYRGRKPHCLVCPVLGQEQPTHAI